MDGLNDGLKETDGLVDGLRDGDFDTDGLVDGLSDGLSDGDKLGDLLTDGLVEGLIDTDGLTDGDRLGLNDGLSEGLTEVDNDGLIDGDTLDTKAVSSWPTALAHVVPLYQQGAPTVVLKIIMPVLGYVRANICVVVSLINGITLAASVVALLAMIGTPPSRAA